MVLKKSFSFCHSIPVIPREQISLKTYINNIYSNICNGCKQPEEKEDDLNPAYDGEASEESHGASDETQLGLRLDLPVSLDVVEGGRVKASFYQL